MTVRPEETRAMREALGQDPLTGEPKWLKRQRKLFTNFVNAKLMDRDISPVTNIFEDLKDGRILWRSSRSCRASRRAHRQDQEEGALKKAETRIDHVSNLSIVFRYINQTTKITGIGPADVADGNETLILGLLWSLIVFFTARDLGGVDDVSALKKKLLRWAQKRTAKNPDVEVRNLKDSFKGGRAFLAILHDVDAEGSPYEPSAVATDNFKAAFDDAADKYGVPVLLDGDDADLWKEEQGMARARRVLAAVAPDAFGVAFGCRGLATLRLEASRGAGPSKPGAPPGPTPTLRRRPAVATVKDADIPRFPAGTAFEAAMAGVAPADLAAFGAPPAPPADLCLQPGVSVAPGRRRQRPAAFAPAPAHLPLAAAVAAALPNAATYGVGGPATRLGATGEAAAFGDLHGAVKTLIKLLAALKAVPKRTNAAPVDAAALFP
ncbi:hypothetical protein JL722_3005 [Aureococcus anophagefferens]|nr:hypothetical protein JL722_3005 [Aureococcus anophagefferens]